MNKITVLIADDCPAVTDGLRRILRPCPDIEVVGAARDGFEALGEAEEVRPSVVLLDAQIPGIDSAEVTRRLKRTLPAAKILLMAVHTAHIDAPLEAGADGFIMKDSSRHELIDSIRKLGSSIPEHALS